MVLEHVPDGPRLLVERAAVLHADRFGHRDLHVVDVPPVPERLEDPVAEPEDEQVPDGLLPEVVVDAVDLRLAEDPEDLAVELLRGFEVAPEGLLDDHPAPAAVVLLVVEAAPPELADDLRERRRLGRQVEQQVRARLVLEVHLLEALGQRVERRVVAEVAAVVRDPLEEVAFHLRLELDPAVRVEGRGDVLAERRVVVRAAADGEEAPVGGQEVRPPELGEGREDLAMGQIARRAEQDDDVRIRHPLEAKALAEEIRALSRGRAPALAVARESLLADRQPAGRADGDPRGGPGNLHARCHR